MNLQKKPREKHFPFKHVGGAWVQRPKTLHILFYISETNGQRRDCTPFKTKSHLQTMSPNVLCSIPLQHLTMPKFRKFQPFFKIFYRINLIFIEIVILVVKNVSSGFQSWSHLICHVPVWIWKVRYSVPIPFITHPSQIYWWVHAFFYTAKWVGSGLLCMSKI